MAEEMAKEAAKIMRAAASLPPDPGEEAEKAGEELKIITERRVSREDKERVGKAIQDFCKRFNLSRRSLGRELGIKQKVYIEQNNSTLTKEEDALLFARLGITADPFYIPPLNLEDSMLIDYVLTTKNNKYDENINTLYEKARAYDEYHARLAANAAKGAILQIREIEKEIVVFPEKLRLAYENLPIFDRPPEVAWGFQEGEIKTKTQKRYEQKHGKFLGLLLQHSMAAARLGRAVATLELMAEFADVVAEISDFVAPFLEAVALSQEENQQAEAGA